MTWAAADTGALPLSLARAAGQRTVLPMRGAAGHVPSMGGLLSAAWDILRQAWLLLVALSVTCWLPVAVLAYAWYRAADMRLVLPADPSALPAVEIGSPAAALAGIPLLLLSYVAAVSVATAATSRVAADVLGGATASYLQALSWGARRSGRAALAYLALVVPALLLAAAAAASGVAAAYAAAPAGNWHALAAGAAAVSVSGLLAAAAWLWLYSRWCLVGPAAALGSRDAPPWTQSAQATRGRSLRVLLRVLALGYLVAVAMSAPAAILLLAQLGPAALAGMAVVLRILTTVITAVLTGTATTPLYLELIETVDCQPGKGSQAEGTTAGPDAPA